MKKTILLAAAALTLGVSSASAALEQSPIYYEENFKGMLDGDHLKDGWTSRGIDAVPLARAKNFYGTLIDGSNPENPVYGAPYKTDILLDYAGKAIAMVNTSFEGDVTPDQWIISPEIEVKGNLAEIRLDLAAYSLSDLGYGEVTYDVMVSETGTASEDFTKIFSSSLINDGKAEVATSTILVPMTNYGGKKVHIAFHTSAKNVGFIGISNLQLGHYAFDYTNTTTTIGKIGDKIPVRVNIGMKTAAATTGVNAVLEFNDKKIEKFFKKQFYTTTSNWIFQLIQFNKADELINIVDKKTVEYKLTITPVYKEDAEGNTPEAVSTVITGNIISVEKEYPTNVVVEEATASGCGWCPRGIGAMRYYRDVLPGGDGKGKFIGINIHSYMNYYDPMNEGVEAYVSHFTTTAGTGGLPMANFNRAINGKDPSDYNSFKSLSESASIYKAEITRADMPETIKSGDELTFGVELRAGFSGKATGKGLNLALVLVENDVKGNDTGYSQENNLYKYNSSSTIGAPAIPAKYYTDFFAGGALGTSMIRFDKMVFQEVARGIYPTYYGESFGDNVTFVCDQPVLKTLGFKVPENLCNVNDNGDLDLSKFEVVALVIDNETGEIVASDVRGLGEKFAGVNYVGGDSAIKVSRDGDIVAVAAPAAVKVALYGVDGVCLGIYESTDGQLNIDASALNGVVIVRAESGNEAAVRKLVF